MTDRRTLLRTGSAAALGVFALTAFAAGADPAEAVARQGRVPLPDPATTPVPNPPFPEGLTRTERAHLRTFDELGFDVFTHADWDRLGESHAQNIRVHWPDGHYTDGIDKHITDLAAMFVWAPDTRISEHPIRIAKNDLTSVTGVMCGTFTGRCPTARAASFRRPARSSPSTWPPSASGTATASWTKSSSSGTT
jgi:hypothetical protein